MEHSTAPPAASDERFRKLAENIREIFWILDPATYRVLYINPAFERITGLKAEDLYAETTSWRHVIDPRDRARVIEEMERSNRAGKAHNIEGRIVRPDGEIRWLWARGLPVREESGEVVIVGVAEDITERKRAERHLERSLSLLRATLHATADGILALDGRNRITTFNGRFVELWRIPDFVAVEAGHDEPLWKFILEQLSAPEEFRDRLQEIAARPRADSFDLLEFADGRVFEAYTRPRRIGDEVNGRVWSFRDTTARAKAERELRERTRRVDVHNQVLVELARQPITDEADQKAAIARIAEAAAEMLGTARVSIWLYEPGRESIRLLDVFEKDAGNHESGELIRRDESPAYFGALEEERALAIHDVHADPRTVDLADSYCARHGISSMLDAPVRAGGEVAGIVCFEHVGPARQWTVEDESFAGSIADLVSIAIEALDRKRAEWGLELLAEAGAILSSSLDYRTTIDNVAQLAVPELAEWCVVDLIEDGEIRRAASRHAETEPEEVLRELARRYPPDWSSSQATNVVLRTGEPELVREVTQETLDARVHDGDHRRLIEALGLRSYMAVPLRARDRTLGTITFASNTRNFGDDDLALALELAGRAALAIDNATLYERAQESNRAKSNFLAVMSHELRTPLTAILGFTELLLSGTSGPIVKEQSGQLERIKLGGQDLVRMIDEVLAFAEAEAGGDPSGLQTVDLTQLLRDFAKDARPIVEDAGLEFRFHVPDEPFSLDSDPKRLEHILRNLVANAVRFTETGSVDLQAEMEDGRVLIRVVDTGIGIEPDKQDQIFEPFVQVEEAITREKGGAGLGLAVALRLARQVGGDIAVNSTPAKGSTFTLRLPAPAGATSPADDGATSPADDGA